MNKNAAKPTLTAYNELQTSYIFDAESKNRSVKFHDLHEAFEFEKYFTKEEIRSFDPELIFLRPTAHIEKVEKYEVNFQFPKLDNVNRKKLRLEIEQDGRVLVPLILTPSAAGSFVCLDGWARYEISRELELPCAAVVLHGLTPEQKQEVFLSSNLCRRQMLNGEKRKLASTFRDAGMSNARIARLLGVSPSTVSKWFTPKKELSSIEKIAIELDKATREIRNVTGVDQRRKTPEQRMLAQAALSNLVSKHAKLQEAFDGLVRYLEEDLPETEAPEVAEACQRVRATRPKRHVTRPVFGKRARIVKRIKKIKKSEKMVKFHHGKKPSVRFRAPP